MNDMSTTIVAKSDQINAADLIGIDRTVTIKEVRIKAGEDQPVTVLIEGDQKAFRPCKGVRRLMVRVWGADASKYIGQSMTLFCDPSVTWAGKAEGGIRVSHMSGLDEEIIEYMRVSRAATKPYKILPLQVQQKAATSDAGHAKAAAWLDTYEQALKDAFDADELTSIHERATANVEKLRKYPDLHERALALRPQSAAGEGSAADPVNEGEEAAASPQPSMLEE